MKASITIFLFLFICFISPASAQTGFVWQNPKPQGNTLLSTKFVNASTGWAVGYDGTIMKTVDGGKTWITQKSASTAALTGVYFIDQNMGWAVGGNTILKTTNGGDTWSVLTTTAPTALSSVYFFNSTTGIISGYGQMLKTTDGGNALTVVATGTTVNFSNMLSVFFVNSRLGWSVGTNGRVLSSTDGGSTWNAQTSNTTQRLNSVYFSDSLNGLAFGDYGTRLATANGGVTWSSTTVMNNHINSTFFVNANTGWAATESNSDSTTIYKTTNAGRNWTSYWYGSERALTSVNFIDTSRGWIVGHGGSLLWTIDAGRTWTPASSGMTTPLISAYFLNPLLGWAVGERGGTARTTDGGAHWTAGKIPNASYLNGVCFVNKDTGVVAAGFGAQQVYWTGDGGNTWKTAVTPKTNYFLNSVFFRNRDAGWCVGFSGIILKTGNSGANWVEQTSGTTNDLYSVYFCNRDTGFAVGNNGTILRTNNGGGNWFPQVSGSTNTIFSVFFADTLNGWCSGRSGLLLRTRNGGGSWEKLNSPIYNSINGIQFVNLNVGYAACDYGQILRTTDGGNTWTVVPSGTANKLYSVFFTDLQTGWFAGDYGTILKTTTGGSVSSVDDKTRSIPEDIRLEQNYPNPFNPSTNVEFQLSHFAFVSLKIFDLLGREVSTLVNETCSPGLHSVRWDGSGHPSGIYFYRLQAGEYVETKRMILLK